MRRVYDWDVSLRGRALLEGCYLAEPPESLLHLAKVIRIMNLGTSILKSPCSAKQYCRPWLQCRPAAEEAMTHRDLEPPLASPTACRAMR